MKLLRYRVTDFRSVEDSGWIDCDDVTTLVGINESGKSNLLLALWKLNPARGGEIDILHDMPVSKLSELRKNIDAVTFISADFELDEENAMYIDDELRCSCQRGMVINISRLYDGKYVIKLPESIKKIYEKKEALDDEKLQEVILHELPKFVALRDCQVKCVN